MFAQIGPFLLDSYNECLNVEVGIVRLFFYKKTPINFEKVIDICRKRGIIIIVSGICRKLQGGE